MNREREKLRFGVRAKPVFYVCVYIIFSPTFDM
jgi:hypothetical protein